MGGTLSRSIARGTAVGTPRGWRPWHDRPRNHGMVLAAFRLRVGTSCARSRYVENPWAEFLEVESSLIGFSVDAPVGVQSPERVEERTR